MAARLGFPDPHYMLGHSVEVKIPMSAYGSAAEAAYRAEFVQLSNVNGERALEEARDFACKHGFDAQTIMLSGEAASALGQYADDTHADLIAVHSDRKGRLGSFFLGSVSRGLAIGAHQSILISKGEIEETGPLTAVFATDHSPFANRSLDRFISMKPTGIKAIKVITVFHHGSKMAVDQPEPLYAAVFVEDSHWHDMKQKTELVVEKLRNAGYSCSGELVDSHVNDGISKLMHTSKADLLVMGAQGHGFIHRMMLGSTSLHQVVAEPYPVLIVRG
jgi:nucleotide-binding universal stress UspA family protein